MTEKDVDLLRLLPSGQELEGRLRQWLLDGDDNADECLNRYGVFPVEEQESERTTDQKEKNAGSLAVLSRARGHAEDILKIFSKASLCFTKLSWFGIWVDKSFFGKTPSTQIALLIEEKTSKSAAQLRDAIGDACRQAAMEEREEIAKAQWLHEHIDIAQRFMSRHPDIGLLRPPEWVEGLGDVNSIKPNPRERLAKRLLSLRMLHENCKQRLVVIMQTRSQLEVWRDCWQQLHEILLPAWFNGIQMVESSLRTKNDSSQAYYVAAETGDKLKKVLQFLVRKA